jgi:restriction endonuclease Mrr
MIVTEITNLEKEELYIKIKDGVYIRTVHFSDEGMEITENILDDSS